MEWDGRKGRDLRETWLIGQGHPDYPDTKARQDDGSLVPQKGGLEKRKQGRCSQGKENSTNVPSAQKAGVSSPRLLL